MRAGFLYRQRIHVSPQPDGTVTVACAQDADNADAFMHLQPQIAQDARYLRFGALLVKAKLRVAVKISPKFCEAGRINHHLASPANTRVLVENPISDRAIAAIHKLSPDYLRA
jgi:hypothetical protein